MALAAAFSCYPGSLFLQVFSLQTKSKASNPTGGLEEGLQEQQPPVTSEANAKPATGALADILDLDFGPVHNSNSEVNQRNRQYILEQQLPDQLSEAAPSKSYSTREPLRPSVEAASKFNENNIIEANKAALSSSNSSTASSSGSRRPSAASGLRRQLEPQAHIEAGGGNVLRDTKIEIAGKPPLFKRRLNFVCNMRIAGSGGLSKAALLFRNNISECGILFQSS